MQPTVTIKRLGWLAAATIVLGVLIGVGAGLLTLLLYGVEHVLLGYIEGPELSGPFGVPAARRAISVTVGLSIAGIIWYLLRHKTTAVPSVKKAVAGKRMPFWQTIVHVVLQIFIVAPVPRSAEKSPHANSAPCSRNVSATCSISRALTASTGAWWWQWLPVLV